MPPIASTGRQELNRAVARIAEEIEREREIRDSGTVDRGQSTAIITGLSSALRIVREEVQP